MTSVQSLSCNLVGVVHSTVMRSEDMPRGGVPATLEVFPEFTDGLLGIESNTHIVVVGWLHKADRSELLIQRDDRDDGLSRRGVFACRSPARPNPIGVTTVKLLRREGNRLQVSSLDMIDGTPILDIKPHSAGFDGVFSARSARDLAPFR